MIEPVPTSVVRGPDGALYVGQLTGFPFVPGLANIYRVVPGQNPGGPLLRIQNIVSMAFEPGGNLYLVRRACDRRTLLPAQLWPTVSCRSELRARPSAGRTRSPDRGRRRPTERST